MRITPALIRVADDTQLWSNRYERILEDIFTLQSDIANKVIERLGVTLREGERSLLASVPTDNVDAYALYLKGRYFWYKRTEQDIQTALTYFRDAIDLDPSYALAHVGITDAWIFRGWYSVLAPHEAFPRALDAVGRALEFGEDLAEPHTSRAHIAFEYDYDWALAEQEYLRAIDLDPNYALAHHWYGGFLSAMSRHDEALARALRARDLDPLSLIVNTWVGLRHYFAGRYEMAIEEYLEALRLGPSFAVAHWHLTWAYEQAGRYSEALASAHRAVELTEGRAGAPLYLASLGHAFAKTGDEPAARAILSRLQSEASAQHVSAFHVAAVHAALGDLDAAFDGLDRAIDERDPWIGYMKVDPRLDPLRADPRFTELLNRVGLDP